MGLERVAAGLLLAYAGYKIYVSQKRKAFFNKTKENKPGVVYLYMPKRWCTRTPNPSIWAMKLEAFLRLNKIPYVVESVSDFSLSPSGTIPFVGVNGKLVGDSQLCIEFIAKELKIDMDSHLTPEQHAVGTALRRLTEDNLAPHYYRTMMVDNMQHLDPLFKDLQKPMFLVRFMFGKYRKNIINKLNSSGLGDLSDDRYQEEQRRNIKAVETLLGSKKYLFGDKPSSYDLGVLSVFSHILTLQPWLKANTKGVEALYESAVLKEYVNRFYAAVYPDFKTLCGSPAEHEEHLTYA